MPRLACAAWFLFALVGTAGWAEPAAPSRAEQLRTLRFDVDEEARTRWQSMVRDSLRSQLDEANRSSSQAWYAVESKADWEAMRQPRLAALRRSLNLPPTPKKPIRIERTAEYRGDGFVVHNITYETRPGGWVSANLYLPSDPSDRLPGIILSHSHHRPKEQGELQDMGMTWARAGCAVLVPDHLGHGERGQHGFRAASDFAREFRVSRQDYYFRYDSSVQLYLCGESLMSHLAWDLMRGVDVLLAQKGVDPKRIALLGAVAGGGDPAAVAAALDDRIAAAVPFNFGGPQPETRYPLPEDAETWFNYAGSGSWESTRNLHLSARDGFLPWVIVGGIAPRRLVFAHEFNWHRERDPVWKRLNRIYELHDTPDRLSFTFGSGEVTGNTAQDTHCTNIGRHHRRLIHPAFKQWFDVEAEEYSKRLDNEALRVWKEPWPHRELLHTRLAKQTADALAPLRNERAEMTIKGRRRTLRLAFNELLGHENDGDPPEAKVLQTRKPAQAIKDVDARQIVLETESGIEVPFTLLMPSDKKSSPVVICLAQSGGAGFLKHRAEQLDALLEAKIGVCLVDIRGTGVSSAGDWRGRSSAATSRAATALMLGRPKLGQQLHDLRSVLKHLWSLDEVDAARIAVWGDSFAKVNAADTNFAVPRRIDGRPSQVEPLGTTLPLVAMLYERELAAVAIHGGLTGFQSALDSPYVHLPLDSVVPGMLTVADLADMAAAATRPLCYSQPVDALNRQVDMLPAEYEQAKMIVTRADVSASVAWLIERLEVD